MNESTMTSPNHKELPINEALEEWRALAKPLEDAGFRLHAFDPGLQLSSPDCSNILSLSVSQVRRINAAIAGEPTLEMREQLIDIPAQTFDEWANRLSIPNKERPAARQAWDYAKGLGYFQGRVDAENDTELAKELADED